MTKDEFLLKYGEKVICKVEVNVDSLEEYIDDDETFDEKIINIDAFLENLGSEIEEGIEEELGDIFERCLNFLLLFKKAAEEESKKGGLKTQN